MNKEIRILHLTHGIYKGNGLETFLINLINHTSHKFKHYLSCHKSKFQDIGLKTENLFIDSLDDIINIVNDNNINILHIHFTGFECFNSNYIYTNDKVYSHIELFPIEVQKKLNISDRDKSMYGYINFKQSDFKNNVSIITTCHCKNNIIPSDIYNEYDYLIHVANSNKYNNIPYKRNSVKQIVIPNGIDVNFFIPDLQRLNNNMNDFDKNNKNNNDNKLKVCWVGRLDKFDYEVYKEIKSNEFINNKCDFYYYGSGSIDNKPLENHYFVGAVDNINEKLKDCDIFIYPTTIDSFGLALGEAMSMNLPCIVSQEVKELAGNACLIYNNPKHFINHLMFLISSKRERLRLGNLARIRICKYFSLDNMINEYSKVYQNLIK